MSIAVDTVETRSKLGIVDEEEAGSIKSESTVSNDGSPELVLVELVAVFMTVEVAQPNRELGEDTRTQESICLFPQHTLRLLDFPSLAS